MLLLCRVIIFLGGEEAINGNLIYGVEETRNGKILAVFPMVLSPVVLKVVAGNECAVKCRHLASSE